MKAKMLTPGRCLLWHRWRLAENTGAIRYQECRDCKSRKAESIEGAGYQPLNLGWLCGATENLQQPDIPSKPNPPPSHHGERWK